MRIRLYSIFVLLTVFSCHQASADKGIRIQIQPQTGYTGDTFTLSASMQRTELVEFDLKIPKVDGLQLNHTQTSKLRFEDGLYQQEKIWYFQSTQIGTHQFNDIVLRLNQEQHAVAPLTYTVLAHPPANDSPALQPILPTPQTTLKKSPELWPLVAIMTSAITAIIYYVSKKRLRSRNQTLKSSQPPNTLEHLKTLARQDRITASDIEAALNTHEQIFPDKIRSQMEACIYKPKTDFSKLKEALLE